jgi:hypothetical protein
MVLLGLYILSLILISLSFYTVVMETGNHVCSHLLHLSLYLYL